MGTTPENHDKAARNLLTSEFVTPMGLPADIPGDQLQKAIAYALLYIGDEIRAMNERNMQQDDLKEEMMKIWLGGF